MLVRLAGRIRIALALYGLVVLVDGRLAGVEQLGEIDAALRWPPGRLVHTAEQLVDYGVHLGQCGAVEQTLAQDLLQRLLAIRLRGAALVVLLSRRRSAGERPGGHLVQLAGRERQRGSWLLRVRPLVHLVGLWVKRKKQKRSSFIGPLLIAAGVHPVHSWSQVCQATELKSHPLSKPYPLPSQLSSLAQQSVEL